MLLAVPEFFPNYVRENYASFSQCKSKNKIKKHKLLEPFQFLSDPCHFFSVV